MPLIIKRLKLAYFPVPKVACTSLKHFMHEVKSGKTFTPRVRPNGKTINIHHLYPAIPFEDNSFADLEDMHRISVVRDPVKRLLSAYSNRVVAGRILTEEAAGDKLRALGLPISPDFSTFLEHLDGYCANFPQILHHTRPQTHFLGHDAGYYSRVYEISELSQLRDDVNELAGTDLPMPHKQTGGPKLKVDDLTTEEIDLIQARYANDYLFLAQVAALTP